MNVRFYLSHDIKITCIFGVKTQILRYFTQRYNGRPYATLLRLNNH